MNSPESLSYYLQSSSIQPSISPWSLPVVLVKNKVGSKVFCVDYRQLNGVTKKDSYLLHIGLRVALGNLR